MARFTSLACAFLLMSVHAVADSNHSNHSSRGICIDDILKAQANVGTIIKQCASASLNCLRFNRTLCSDEMSRIFQALGDEVEDVSEAKKDCSGMSVACDESMKHVSDVIGNFSARAKDMANDCDLSPIKCAGSVLKLPADVKSIGDSIHAAALACAAGNDTPGSVIV